MEGCLICCEQCMTSACADFRYFSFPTIASLLSNEFSLLLPPWDDAWIWYHVCICCSFQPTYSSPNCSSPAPSLSSVTGTLVRSFLPTKSSAGEHSVTTARSAAPFPWLYDIDLTWCDESRICLKTSRTLNWTVGLRRSVFHQETQTLKKYFPIGWLQLCWTANTTWGFQSSDWNNPRWRDNLGRCGGRDPFPAFIHGLLGKGDAVIGSARYFLLLTWQNSKHCTQFVRTFPIHGHQTDIFTDSRHFVRLRCPELWTFSRIVLLICVGTTILLLHINIPSSVTDISSAWPCYSPIWSLSIGFPLLQHNW